MKAVKGKNIFAPDVNYVIAEYRFCKYKKGKRAVVKQYNRKVRSYFKKVIRDARNT